MPRDNKPTVKARARATQRDQARLKKKRHQSDDDNSESDNSTDFDEEEDDVDIHEFRKYLNQVFPSKHMRNKINAGEKVNKFAKGRNASQALDKSCDTDDDGEEETEEETTLTRNKSKKHLSKTTKATESDTEEEEEENEDIVKVSKDGKVNIIIAVGNVSEEDDEWEDYTDSDESEEETEDEDVSVSSVEESNDTEEDDDNDDNDSSKSKTVSLTTTNETLEQLKVLLANNPSDKALEKMVDKYQFDLAVQERKKAKKETKQKAKHMRIFRKIMMDKNSMNDFAFYEKLDSDHQKALIKELREINKVTRIDKPYRISLLEANIPIAFKAAAFKKVNMMRMMDAGSGEFNKLKTWVDAFMKMPFTSYRSLPVSIEDGVEACHTFMENAQKTLDQAVYGLSDAKMQIMQMLGQLITNPKSIGTAIAIHGPPGTGKTSLVKEGISKILNRPFAFIALGGATDSAFLEGHGYTYEGSTWGKIVQILMDSQCMNPVIYFDELDKISDTPRGEEIVGILTHLTDTTQNSEFHDRYFSEINFDLSKCLFIFSYNDESKVNPILKDRMYRIRTKGYSTKEKNVIATQYLLPRIQEQVKFAEGDILIPDDVLQYINDVHCHKEDGVRNMKRCLEIIHTKLNLYRLMRPGSNLFEGEMALNVEFPFKVTKDIVDKLIKKDEDSVSKYIRDTMYI